MVVLKSIFIIFSYCYIMIQGCEYSSAGRVPAQHSQNVGSIPSTEGPRYGDVCLYS